ncbi:MAG: LysM peptidoglycan-binding domain-containing protein [Acidimicrobiia bacterium]|nr:LysM peptidoglycan-binding domain-containing protein [Acidimicrobiia bacterium]
MELRCLPPVGTPTDVNARGGARSARFALGALVLSDALAIVGLHRLGTADWASAEWFDSTTWTSGAPEIVITAALRTVALGLAYWVALMVAVAIAASRHDRPAGSRHWATLPMIRHLVDRALVIGVATSTLLAPAVASATEQPPFPVIVEVTTGTPSTPQPIPIQMRAPGPEPKPAIAAAEDTSPQSGQPAASVTASAPGTLSPELRRAGGAAQTHTVQPGDNMWLIAERHLRSNAATITRADVAAYWVQVIDANRDTIRSGDPDLIYPGELLILPEVMS